MKDHRVECRRVAASVGLGPADSYPAAGMKLTVPILARLPFGVAGDGDGIVGAMFAFGRIDFQPGAYFLAKRFSIRRIFQIHDLRTSGGPLYSRHSPRGCCCEGL